MNRRDFLWQSIQVTASAALTSPRIALASDSKQQTRRLAAATGPLRVHPDNPRYFADGTGRAILLTGSHVWNNLVDMGPGDPPPRFDFDAYLDFLQRYHHNFIRLWAWEHVAWDTTANRGWGKDKPHTVAPHPWVRSGSAKALDGKPKFDLNAFNEEYFDRLRERVTAAGQRGIYVSVMLFEGWAMQRMADAWKSHPFNPKNNTAGLDGDANRDGKGLEVHELASSRLVGIQEAYVRRVIDTVNDLDNVLYEITNENHPASTKWQYHMIHFIHAYERKKPKQHPVGMTFQYRGGSNKTLFDGPADWVSPNHEGGYRDNPPAADGHKVILTDTDHLWGIGGNQAWVWKSILRGMNPIFMDPYDGVVLAGRFDPKWEPIRRSMGLARRLAERMELAACKPRNNLSSTRSCLANPGSEYLVYLPGGGKATLDLKDAKGAFAVEWINPGTGKSSRSVTIQGGAKRDFTAPQKGDAVLYLAKKDK